jgi:hypothetical protein
MDEDKNKTKPENRMWREGNYLIYKKTSEVDPETSAALIRTGRAIIDDVFSETKQKVNFLVDVTEANNLDFKSRETWVEFLASEKIHKTGIYGGNIVVKAVVFLVIKESRLPNIKYFLNKEDALHWLNERK